MLHPLLNYRHGARGLFSIVHWDPRAWVDLPYIDRLSASFGYIDRYVLHNNTSFYLLL